MCARCGYLRARLELLSLLGRITKRPSLTIRCAFSIAMVSVHCAIWLDRAKPFGPRTPRAIWRYCHKILLLFDFWVYSVSLAEVAAFSSDLWPRKLVCRWIALYWRVSEMVLMFLKNIWVFEYCGIIWSFENIEQEPTNSITRSCLVCV